MIKVVVLRRRQASSTRERFHRWWLDEHVAYGKWDGIAELWFDDRAALDAAWSSDVGRIALAHSRESHSDRLVLITEEHELIG
jgi:hypothetical protein